jgi:hypothetical protein
MEAQMRELTLVGMAPPKDKKSKTEPFPSGQITSLVPLDPRHGVFPNLVMTPLLAILYAFKEDAGASSQFWSQVEEVLKDVTPRRFNLLNKPSGTTLEISNEAVTRLNQLNTDKDLWAVFGFWTISSLITYLVTGAIKFTKGEAESYSREFVRRACEEWNESMSFPKSVPSTRSALNGILLRLCTDPDPDGNGVVAMMKHATMEMLKPEHKDRYKRIIGILRSCVPLLHNEAYQLVPFGKVQNCFVMCLDPAAQEGQPAPEVYWKFAGGRTKNRLFAVADSVA